MSDSKIHTMAEARANVAAGKVTQPDLIRYISDYVNGLITKVDLVSAFEVAKKRSYDAILRYMADYYSREMADAARDIAKWNRILGEATGSGKQAVLELDSKPRNPTAAETVLYDGYSNGMAPLTAGKLNKLSTALGNSIRTEQWKLLKELNEVAEMAAKSGSKNLPSATIAAPDLVEFFNTNFGEAYTGRLNDDGLVEFTPTGRDLSDYLVFLDGEAEGVIPSATASRLMDRYFVNNKLKDAQNGALINVDSRMRQHLSKGLELARDNVVSDLESKGLSLDRDYSDEELKGLGYSGSGLSSVKNTLDVNMSNGNMIRFSDVKTLLKPYTKVQDKLSADDVSRINRVYPNNSPDSEVGKMIQIVNSTADAYRAAKKASK